MAVNDETCLAGPNGNIINSIYCILVQCNEQINHSDVCIIVMVTNNSVWKRNPLFIPLQKE